jgi:hypothetical protein
MGGKKKKCGTVYPFASNCVALKATGVHTNPQKDAAGKKKTLSFVSRNSKC